MSTWSALPTCKKPAERHGHMERRTPMRLSDRGPLIMGERGVTALSPAARAPATLLTLRGPMVAGRRAAGPTLWPERVRGMLDGDGAAL